MRVVSPGKLDCVSLASVSGLCVINTYHMLWMGEFGLWVAQSGLLFSVGSKGHSSARPYCVSPAILSSAVQDVIPYQHQVMVLSHLTSCHSAEPPS
jgi:hypothetical protein